MPKPSLFTTDLLLTESERGIAQVDGSTIIDLFTEDDVTYHIMIREQGSVCLYCTRPGDGCHYIIYDSFDGREPSRRAREIVKRLSWTRTAIDLLLAHVETNER